MGCPVRVATVPPGAGGPYRVTGLQGWIRLGLSLLDLTFPSLSSIMEPPTTKNGCTISRFRKGSVCVLFISVHWQGCKVDTLYISG